MEFLKLSRSWDILTYERSNLWFQLEILGLLISIGLKLIKLN